MNLVSQKHARGCGIAVLAMLTGQTYMAVAADHSFMDLLQGSLTLEVVPMARITLKSRIVMAIHRLVYRFARLSDQAKIEAIEEACIPIEVGGVTEEAHSIRAVRWAINRGYAAELWDAVTKRTSGADQFEPNPFLRIAKALAGS